MRCLLTELVCMGAWPRGRPDWPIYIAHTFCLSLQRDCLTIAVTHLSLRVLFIAIITLALNNA